MVLAITSSFLSTIIGWVPFMSWQVIRILHIYLPHKGKFWNNIDYTRMTRRFTWYLKCLSPNIYKNKKECSQEIKPESPSKFTIWNRKYSSETGRILKIHDFDLVNIVNLKTANELRPKNFIHKYLINRKLFTETGR